MKVYNQMMIERNVNKCESLVANVINKKDEVAMIKREMLKDEDTYNATIAYIFGKSDENPLEEVSEKYNATLENYVAVCDSLTQEVLQSNQY